MLTAWWVIKALDKVLLMYPCMQLQRKPIENNMRCCTVASVACLILFFLWGAWLGAGAAVGTGAVVVAVDQAGDEIWGETDDQTVGDHCQDTDSLQHLRPNTCR